MRLSAFRWGYDYKGSVFCLADLQMYESVRPFGCRAIGLLVHCFERTRMGYTIRIIKSSPCRLASKRGLARQSGISLVSFGLLRC
jgi:hypothetical protein